jgi:LmbE family N-acetylglucosaminyl deacetylase
MYIPYLRGILIVVLLMVAVAFALAVAEEENITPEDRIENWRGKTVLIFTPHPDDDTFQCGGIMAILAKNGNKVIVVIYTNDNKGSLDLEMTRERLARIRRAEEEEACKVLGVPKENIHWLGYEDGDLEYADPQRLRGEAARFMKIYRPDAIFSIDPGEEYERWHKTDHRMAAFITQDAIIAAEWHLYYPQHYLDEKLESFRVPVAYYYYTTAPNYEVDITGVIDKKIEASAKHVSQFPPSVEKYTPDMPKQTYEKIDAYFRELHKDGDRYKERFRRLNNP